MKNKKTNLIKAQGAAFRLHQGYGIGAPSDLCLETILNLMAAEGLMVKEGPLKGAAGRLIRLGEKGLVRISESIVEIPRKRFTVSHEFGHWSLHRDESQMFLCTEDDLCDYQNDPLETEANQFAAEFLMPKRWIDKSFWEQEPSIKIVRSMASHFGVSYTAAALRYVELCKHSCMVVFAESGAIRWWRKNEGNPYWLESRQMIKFGSVAYDCQNKGSQREGMQSVQPEVWFAHCSSMPAVLLEDSYISPSGRSQASLLWFP